MIHPPDQLDSGYYGQIISRLRGQIANLRYSLEVANEEIKSLKFDPRFSKIERLETENKEYIKEIRKLRLQLITSSSNTHNSSQVNTSQNSTQLNSGEFDEDKLINKADKNSFSYSNTDSFNDNNIEDDIKSDEKLLLENDNNNKINDKEIKLFKNENEIKREQRLLKSQKKKLKQKEQEYRDKIKIFEMQKEENERRMLDDKMKVEMDLLEIEKARSKNASRKLKQLNRAEKEWNDKISGDSRKEGKYRFPPDNFELSALDDVKNI